jgi:hypothetical protein
MTEKTYDATVSVALLRKEEEARSNERYYLKLAARSMRAAKEAIFFGEDDEFYDNLMEENKYRAIADMYAREANDLRRQHNEGWVI